MSSLSSLYEVLQANPSIFHNVVPFDGQTKKLLQLDFSATNTALTEELLTDTNAFSAFIKNLLGEEYLYGIGGYNEHRTIYSRSHKFDGNGEPRRLHLGIDIWGEAGTPVFAPLDGCVHSFAFNNLYGDYGATIVLSHSLAGVAFNTLYGHLSIADLDDLQEGQRIARGVEFAHFGKPTENGYWPPHLHFQIIEDMQGKKGDYRGVCAYSEREAYLQNCPDPNLILNLMQFAVKENVK